MKRTFNIILTAVFACLALAAGVLTASGQRGKTGQVGSSPTQFVKGIGDRTVNVGASKNKEGDEGGTTSLISTCTAINHFVDVGPPGFTTGDMYVWVDDLSIPDGSVKVGQAIGRCNVIDPSTGTFGCTVTSVFDEGTITTELILRNVPGIVSVGAITGGSGRFRDATGELSVDLGPPCGPHKLTIRVRPATLRF